MRIKALYAVPVCLALLLPGPSAEAQTTGGDPLKSLIDDISRELDRAEKDRLADPFFVRDMRQLLGRYQNTWPNDILSEDFSGRDSNPPAPWQVTAGEVLVDWRYGMRSVVEPPPQQAQSSSDQQQQGRGSQSEAVGALVGAILQQAIGGDKKQQQQQEPAQQQPQASDPGYTAVVAPIRIPNAFKTEMVFSSRPVRDGGRRFEFGPYQGANADAGYRLAYTPGGSPGTPSLELIRVSSRGTPTLAVHDQPLNLDDDREHTLVWTRDQGGRMTVTLDGKQLFDVTDQSFRDAFDGFAVVNGGGDYAIRNIDINGPA